MASAVWEDDEKGRHGEGRRGGKLVVADLPLPPRAGLRRRRSRAGRPERARDYGVGARSPAPGREAAAEVDRHKEGLPGREERRGGKEDGRVSPWLGERRRRPA